MALNTLSPALSPADFADILSDQLLLVPDGEFVLARWAFSAAVQNQYQYENGFDLAALQMLQGRLPNVGVDGGVDAAMSQGMGGPLLVSRGMAYPDMFKMVAEAKGPGDVIKIDRPRFIDGATTEANRKLGTTNTVFGTNSQGFTEDQVSVSIVEYGGPGDAGGNVNPISIARFTQHRAKHDLMRQTSYQLRRDRYKFVDDLCISRLLTAANANDTGAASGSSVTRGGNPTVATNAGFTGVGNEPFTFDLIARAVEQLKTRKVPGIALGARYVAVLDQHQYADLKLDPMFQRLAVYDTSGAMNPLFPGYKATVDDLVICESNRMPRLTNLGAGANIPGYQGLVIAPGVLGWASAQPAYVITDKNDDGGRFARFAWSAYEGWQVLDDRFVQLVITD